MGSWGVGLKENDTAADALERYKSLISAVIQSRMSCRSLIMKEAGDSEAVLAIAEALMAKGVSLKPASGIIADALQEEIAELLSWQVPEARRRVLVRFARRAGLGRIVPPRVKNVSRSKVLKLPRSKFDQHECRFSEGLAPVSKNGKYGYVNESLEWIVRPHYDYADDFVEGLARVKIGILPGRVRYGMINRLGRYVIKLIYSEMDRFSEGLAAITKNGRAGYIDRNGRVKIALKFQSTGEFLDGMAAARQKSLWGLIDKRGRWMVRPQLESIESRNSRYLLGYKNDHFYRIEIATGKVTADKDEGH